MRSVLFLALVLAPLGAAEVAVQGRVTDARTGEPLRLAEIRAGDLVARTNADGRYTLTLRDDSEAVLKATLVGYRPLSVTLRPSGAAVDFALHPDTLRQSQSVTVQAGAFESAPPGGQDLAGSELRNLASVLADDPLRAIQSLPGVGAYNDFQSQFTIRGASYERTGIYLDGVLLHQPFHTVQGDDNSATLTLLQGEMLESASLEAGPLAPRYADRGAGAVDFRSREGDPRRTHLRATASASNAGVSAEGPLARKLNWIAAARKSYLQYIIDRTADEPGLAFGFWDVHGKLTATLNASHQLSFSTIRAHSGLDRTTARNRLGLNSTMLASYDSLLMIGTWRATYSRLLVSQRVARLSEDYANANRNRDPLGAGDYREHVWNGDAAVNWSTRAVTEAGWSLRGVRDRGSLDFLSPPPLAARPIERYRGDALRSGYYVQQTWSPVSRLELRAGGRADRHSLSSGTALSPFASLAFPLWRARVSASFGQSAQFGEVRQFVSPVRQQLAEERSTHAQFAVDLPLAERSRLRVELFERRDRDLLFRPRSEPRLDGANRLIPALIPSSWANAWRGRVRGWQAMWQRRSANGLTGWVSYTYAHTNYSDRFSGNRFISDFDLRHQFQTFLSYRLRPTVNVSGRYVYATGLPLRGYFELRNGNYFVAQQRNQLRLPDYQRWDLRVNKALIRKHFQATLFAEVINLTNRRNLAIDDLAGYDTRTGRAFPRLTRTFPVLPSAGVVFDF